MGTDAPRRTPAGDAAVARHAPELDTGVRVVLAAIDGKRSREALKTRFGALVDVDAVLARLAQGGYIEAPAALAPSVPAAPGTATTPATTSAPAAAPFDLAAARRMAVRGLTEVLGPGGDLLAMQIERAKTMADFTALHARAQAVVRAERGEAALKSFLDWSPAPPGP